MITGYGDYSTSSWLPRTLAGLGSKAGGWLGHKVGTGIKAVTGFGDYTVMKNTLKMGKSAPIINPSRGGVCISYREYLGDIISSSTQYGFNVQRFVINPGSRKTFPWMFAIANNFSQWVPEGIIFEFVSMSGNALNSVNTALGQVVMMTQYDAAAPPPNSAAEMLGTEFSNSDRPSDNQEHPVECDRTQTPISVLYTNGPEDVLPSVVGGLQNDPRMYNLGDFYVATQGLQGTSVNCGQLWVNYQISLLKPKLGAALLEDQIYAHIVTLAGNAGSSAPMGVLASSLTSPRDTIGLVGNIASGIFTCYLPRLPYQTRYLMYYYIVGTEPAGNVTGPAVTGFNGSVLTDYTSSPPNGQDAANSFSLSFITTVAANSINANFTIGASGSFCNAGTAQLYVMGVPSNGAY